MDKITVKAPAKINLTLDVLGRRENGYHDLRMIMQTIHLFDRLHIKKTKEPGIQISSKYTPLYDSYYVEGINQLYELDCGKNSGWMYSVNGTFPNYGASAYKPKDGDVILWVYTCDLGNDVGNPYQGDEK